MKRRIIPALLAGVIGSVTGASITGVQLNKSVQAQRTLAQKHLLIMQTFNQWIINKQEGKNLARFFKENGYETIAVYGMSYLGERLLDELKDTGIVVRYGIDKNAQNIYADVEIKSLDDELPEVDAIVVTAVYFFDEIEEELSKRVEYPIISLEDVVYGV